MAENQFPSTVDALFKGMDNFITTKTVVGEPVKIDANTIFYPETQNRTSTQFQMQQFISQCSETEVKLLLNISKTIINTLRTHDGTQIDQK